MEKKKKEELDIYEGDVCQDPTDDIVREVIEDLPIDTYPILDVNRNFLADIAFEEEERAREKAEQSVITPATLPSPSQVVKNSMMGSVKINLKPGNSPLANAIANPVENDNLVSVIRENKPVSTILNTVMEEIAEEAAYIKAWRNENWNTGEDISEATFKRIKMLKHLVETIVEQEKLKRASVTGKVDFHGEAFQRVLKFFMETILKTFKKVHIPVQFEDIFFTELAKEFSTFEKDAERIYYGKD